MQIPVKVGVKGKVKATLTDIRTGKKDVFEQDNLLLDSFLDRWFTQNVILLSANTMNTCVLGTDDTPPTPSDTALGGTTLASSSAGTTVYADVAPNEKLPALPALPDRGYSCSFSPDGKYLAAAHSGSPYVTVYDVEDSFTKISALSTLSGTGSGCAFSPDGKYLAVAHSNSPYITIYGVENGFTKLPALSALSGAGNGCAFSPDGKYLAAAHYNSPYITVYDVMNGFEKLPALSALSGTGYSCSFSPDGKYLAVSHSNSPRITVYDVENGFEKLPNLSALPGAGYGCSFSSDGKYLAVAHSDSPRITVYDVMNGFEKLPALSALSGEGKGCSFSSDGKYLAVAHSDSPRITVYGVEDSFTKLPALSALPYTGYGCAFSPDGKYLAAAHENSPRITVYGVENPAITERSMTQQWTFVAGVGTGEVKELMLRTTTTSPYTNSWVSRIVLDEPLDKTEFHQLDVEWELSVFHEGAIEGTIPNGQRDGETDVGWTLRLLPKMLHSMIMSGGKNSWFGITGTPALATGTNNDFEDILVWWGNGIQGTQFARYDTTAIREVEPYVPGSLERTVRLFLEVDQGNEEPIAEMAMENFARLTFDPPLDKADTHRLYVDVTFGFEREE